MKRLTLILALALATVTWSDVTTRPIGGGRFTSGRMGIPPGPPGGVPAPHCPCWTEATIMAASVCPVGKSAIASCGGPYSLLIQCVPFPLVTTGWFVAPQIGGSCTYDADGVGPPWDVALTISADEWKLCRDSIFNNVMYPLACPHS